MKTHANARQPLSLKAAVPVFISVVLLAGYVRVGLTGLSASMKDLKLETGQWITSDSWFTRGEVADSSEGFRTALSRLPPGDLILFVAPKAHADLGYSLAYFHTYYFGAPRRMAAMTCDGPGRSVVFVGQVPAGSKKLAGVVFYSAKTPLQFPDGVVLSSRLTVVPLSKPLEEISDWTSFCPQ